MSWRAWLCFLGELGVSIVCIMVPYVLHLSDASKIVLGVVGLGGAFFAGRIWELEH